MPINIDAFLHARGFRSNPFQYTNAEQEREQLASYFVRMHWFERLLGNPVFPESLLLFAPQGYGKTMHRLEVARIAGNRRIDPALVVNFTDFGMLLSGSNEHVEIEHYLALIRQCTLEALDTATQQHARRNKLLRESQTAYLRFCALLQMYAPLRFFDRNPPANEREEIERLVHAFQQTRLGIKDWLKELSHLAQAAGYASVYVLIDGIDETAQTRSNPATAAAMLGPLLDAPGVLQECGFAFKFFLPDSIESALHEQDIGRLDRLPHYRLNWSEDELRDMLAKRLTSYSLISETSQTGYVNQFDNLCASQGQHRDEDADQLLVRAAHESPRRLIDLAQQIVEHHCQQASDVQALIERQTLHEVLERQASQSFVVAATAVEAVAQVNGDAASVLTSSVLQSTPAPSPESEPPLLFFDEHGDIWIGNQRRNDRPLPKQLRKCMEHLWNNRHRTVRYDELLEALYGESLSNRGDPKNSCDKIIRRLREVLEPDQPSSPTYIRVQPGTGYELRHFRDHEE
jgi:hypothetical protein